MDLLLTFACFLLDEEGVVIENGTFSWSKDGPPCLKRYNVVIIILRIKHS